MLECSHDTNGAIFALAGLALGAAIVVLWLEDDYSGVSTLGTLIKGCSIKGNVSIFTGERIYHSPGQEYYSSTYLNPFRSERLFCTESAAASAGWRKAMR